MQPKPCSPAERSYDVFAEEYETDVRLPSGWALSKRSRQYVNAVSMRSTPRAPVLRHQLYSPVNGLPIIRQINDMSDALLVFHMRGVISDVVEIVVSDPDGFRPVTPKPGVQKDSPDPAVDVVVLLAKTLLANVRAELRSSGALDDTVDGSQMYYIDRRQWEPNIELYGHWKDWYGSLSDDQKRSWANAALLQPCSLPEQVRRLFASGSGDFRVDVVEFGRRVYELCVTCAFCVPPVQLAYWTVGEWVFYHGDLHRSEMEVDDVPRSLARVLFPGVVDQDDMSRAAHPAIVARGTEALRT